MSTSAKRRKSSELTPDFVAQTRPKVLNVVPWSHSDEWFDVRKKILDGSAESIKLALSRLRIWELRCDSKKCPPFVEATIHLLRAFVVDQSKADTSEILSVYGEAINKFVQTILERSGKPGENLQNKTIAENLRIPQWVVDVRNDAIHHFRGSLPLYRTTANTVFEWLKQTYWGQEKQEKTPEKQPVATAIDSLFQEYIQLAISAKSPSEISLADSAFANLREVVSRSERAAIVAHLVEQESLITFEGGHSLIDISPNYKKAYLPIFALLEDDLTTLFVEALKTFSLPVVVCSNQKTDLSMRILFLWLSWLVSGTAIFNNVDLASNLNFKKILKAAITVVSESTLNILEICFYRMDPPLSEKKIDFIRNVYVAYSGERAETCDGINGFDKISIATVEHVVAERANRNKLTRNQSQSTAQVDWSVIPLGLLPDTVSVGNLYLDVDVDEDYVPFDVETEDEVVVEHERKFLENQRQVQEVKIFNQEIYEDARNALLASDFQLWRIANPQAMLEESDDAVYGYNQSAL